MTLVNPISVLQEEKLKIEAYINYVKNIINDQSKAYWQPKLKEAEKTLKQYNKAIEIISISQEIINTFKDEENANN
jgi:hypothetical protein